MTNQDVPCGNKGCGCYDKSSDGNCKSPFEFNGYSCKLYRPDPTEKMYRIQDCIPKEAK